MESASYARNHSEMMNGLSLEGDSIKLTAVKRRKQKIKWSMGDVTDLELWLEQRSLWKLAWKEGGKDELAGLNPKNEKERRRMGFFLMLQKVRAQRGQGDEEVGCRLESGLRVTEVMIGLLMFLLGIGLVRGLLTEFSYDGEKVMRGFNIWVFLAVTLGLQWCVLIIAMLGYITRKKWLGVMGPVHRLLSSGIKKWGGVQLDREVWDHVIGGAGRKLWGWRMTRMFQTGSLGYNLGMLVGLFGCLWFLNVSFFWETTLPQFGEQSLRRVTEVLSAPVGGGLLGDADIELTQVGSVQPAGLVENSGMAQSLTPRMQANLSWSLFFFVAIAFWGFGPRLLLWLGAWWMEKRVLAHLDFQESRHRSLWRELHHVERGEISSAPADGVVVLDIGGLEVETETMRPYFLQVLRVNPESRYSLGTLDGDGEIRALEAAREAALGVVFLVEGWSLSPKQMVIYHQKVRAAIGVDQMIRYLVLDAKEEEMEQWVSFVDGLKDSETEVFRYE